MINPLGNGDRLMPPLRDRDHTQGPINAAVVLMEYGDYQCPRSGQAYFIVRGIQAQLVDQLCFVFRHFPQPQSYPQAQKAAETVEAAAAQGKFWEMHDTLFEHQDALEDGNLVEYAAQLGLDIPRFLRELSDHVHAKHVQEDIDSGVSNGVAEAPTFFISIRHQGTQNLKGILAAILEAAAVEPN